MCVQIVKHLLHVCFLFATGTESRDVFLLEARAALEKTLGGELLAAVWAQHLVTLPTHLHQGLQIILQHIALQFHKDKSFPGRAQMQGRRCRCLILDNDPITEDYCS